MDNKPMFNAYPDSIGKNLSDGVAFLSHPEVKGGFSAFYILPSIFHTDLDRGFSVIDYSLNKMLVKQEDLEELREHGILLKLDFILNHASVLSEQFQDILAKGDASPYRDFFIDWNKFWEGHGTMTDKGYIQPYPELIQDMFFRKPGLPILMVRFPDGREVPYWNTFYQKVLYPVLDAQDIMKICKIQYNCAEQLARLVNKEVQEGKTPENMTFPAAFEACKQSVSNYLNANRKYLGQMDLNLQSPLVWDFYKNTLEKLARYGAGIVRLDAFAYAPKTVGKKNFLNEPDTWELLDKIKEMADSFQLKLLPEIHAGYEEKTYETIAQTGFMTYDFFLPGLIIDALESGDGQALAKWANEIREKRIRTVNMLGCHDGIPLLDLKGLLPEERIQQLIDIVVSRGGYVKDLHGQKNMYYQVNATYFSALGEDERKLLLARALQLFMPGKPQIWYLDLLAGTNDYEAVRKAGVGGHKEVNRTNLTREQAEAALEKEVVKKQLELLKFRNSFPAFSFTSDMKVEERNENFTIFWKNGKYETELKANLLTYHFDILAKVNNEIVKQIKD